MGTELDEWGYVTDLMKWEKHERFERGQAVTVNGKSHSFVLQSRVLVDKHMGVCYIGWFVVEKPIKMDDLGVPLFQETSISTGRPIPGRRSAPLVVESCCLHPHLR